MMDKIRFPLVFDGGKVNGLLYMDGKDIKMDNITYMIKNVFPRTCEMIYKDLLDRECKVNSFNYHRDVDFTDVSIATTLHIFNLRHKDDKYEFTVYDLNTDEYVRRFDLLELVDLIPMELMSDMFTSTTDIDLMETMMYVLFSIMIHRFIVKK